MAYTGHPPEFRLQVIADSIDLGVNAAAKKHGVSRETIRRWRKQRGVRVQRRKMEAP